MPTTPRFAWVLTAVSKTLAALDRGLAALGRPAVRTPERRIDNQNRS